MSWVVTVMMFVGNSGRIDCEKDAMTATLISGLLRFVAKLPRAWLQRMGIWLGWISYLFNSRASRVTRVNLALCLGVDATSEDALETLTKQSLIETGKTFMETPRVWFGPAERIDRWIAKVHSESTLIDLIKADTGTVILLPHLGNWELFNVAMRRYGRMTALFSPPRQPYLKPLLSAVRLHHGNHMVPANRRGVSTLYRTLQSGGTVVVLPDQVPANGCYAPFFGHAALTDALTGRLLKKTGARAVGAAMVRRDDGAFELHIIEPDPSIYDADSDVSARAVNQLVERCVDLAPTQYQWEYKRFRKRPVGEPKVYRFNKSPGFH